MKYLSTLLLVLSGIASYGQTTLPGVHDSAGVKKIIFEDDFSGDSVGTFPKKWHISPAYAKPDDGKGCTVALSGNRHVFAVAKNRVQIFNNIHLRDFAHDVVHIDFDFLLKDINADLNLLFSAKDSQGNMKDYTTDVIMWLQNERDQGIYLLPYCWEGKYWSNNNFKTDKLSHFSALIWHHFSMTSCEGTIKCYIDRFRVFSAPNTEYVPASLMFSFAGPLEIAGVRVYTTDNYYTFSDITKQNKLITYAIHFDQDAFTIKQESEKFLRQLADWLKANPTVNLEIDGHTDNDGGDAHNLQLSQQRADAVKAMLVSLGINKARLTTKGYGASKPLKPNTTPEGKAENRRVEFIRK